MFHTTTLAFVRVNVPHHDPCVCACQCPTQVVARRLKLYASGKGIVRVTVAVSPARMHAFQAICTQSCASRGTAGSSSARRQSWTGLYRCGKVAHVWQSGKQRGGVCGEGSGQSLKGHRPSQQTCSFESEGHACTIDVLAACSATGLGGCERGGHVSPWEVVCLCEWRWVCVSDTVPLRVAVCLCEWYCASASGGVSLRVRCGSVSGGVSLRVAVCLCEWRCVSVSGGVSLRVAVGLRE
eukprot:360637-Chlamydomonas_euryale.AAC.10